MADEQGAIPEGMKAWAGGDSAPADYAGGVVLMRDGDRFTEEDNGCPLYWTHDGGLGDIIAYTPAADRLTDTGEGWVAWNPDSGEEYTPDHPVKSGECVEAERIRRSTPQEDVLWKAFQEQFMRAEALSAALATHRTADAGAMREPHVFLDCDGVLADFDTYAEAYFGMNPREYEKKMGSAAFWKQLEAKGDFYRNLPLMPDAMALYEGVKHLHPTILTGCPRGDWAQGQKVAWAAEHFPGVPIITCRSADKRDYAKPGDVIIDDWPQHRHRWIEMGGVFIVHHDAASSLAALWAHYPDLIRNLPDAGEPL